MLELGRSGAHGTAKGTVPVLSDGVGVATLRASSWKDAATAEVGSRSWMFTKRGRELTGRWAAEPEDAVRLRAREESFWKGAWSVELDGVPVEVDTVSRWKGTRRFSASGRKLAESGRTRGWNPRPTLTADPALPLDSQVFLLWLELVAIRRNAAAAAT
ncbi:hypothetical protein [Modestobacter lapidis]|nr:hypothetical protein [Modestobacter lapidis]